MPPRQPRPRGFTPICPTLITSASRACRTSPAGLALGHGGSATTERISQLTCRLGNAASEVPGTALSRCSDARIPTSVKTGTHLHSFRVPPGGPRIDLRHPAGRHLDRAPASAWVSPRRRTSWRARSPSASRTRHWRLQAPRAGGEDRRRPRRRSDGRCRESGRRW